MVEGFELSLFSTKEISTNKKYRVGTVWESTQGEDFTIIAYSAKEYIWKDRITYPYVIIEFENGFKKEVGCKAILSKEVKNPFFPIIHGIGFIGYGRHRSVVEGHRTKEYQTWTGMLTRCYAEELEGKNKTYKDCDVDKRWHNFQNFCDDLPSLKNYTSWKTNIVAFAWDLDKDMKVIGNKVYSKDTCIFAEHQKNSAFSALTGLTYIGTHKETNRVEEFTNQAEFCRKHNLIPTNVTKVIKRKPHCKSTHGWTFKIKETKSEHNKKNI